MMADRDRQLITYVTEEEYQTLKDWSEDTGKSMSQLLRQAVLEYTDHDRSRRIEEKVDRILDRMDALEDDDTHTHKDEGGMKRASDSLEKARKIVRRLQENHGDVISNADVIRAIEDIAGVDDRTIRKYQDIFRRRGLLFEHPGENAVWTTEGNQWLTWMEQYATLNGQDEVERVAAKYDHASVSAGFDGTLDITLAEVTDQ